MSYVRFSQDSSVYVYLDVSGYLCCCGCALVDDGSLGLYTTEDMLAHLRAHENAGHAVPERAYMSLRADQVENDAWILAERAKKEHPAPSGEASPPNDERHDMK